MATCAELGWEVLAGRLHCWNQRQLAAVSPCSALCLRLDAPSALLIWTFSCSPAYPHQRHSSLGAASPPQGVTATLGLGAKVLLPRNMLSPVVQSLNVGYSRMSFGLDDRSYKYPHFTKLRKTEAPRGHLLAKGSLSGRQVARLQTSTPSPDSESNVSSARAHLSAIKVQFRQWEATTSNPPH